MQGRLDVGAVIRRVFHIYVDQASVLMPAAAVVFVFTGIIAAVLVVASPGLVVFALIIDLMAGTLFTGMVVELVADVQDGRRDASPGQLLRAATPVLGQLILVGIVAAIGIVVGFILIIIPGLILITIWSVAAPVVVLENPGVFAALRRSRELVRGNGWQVFGVILVLYIVVGVISFIIEAVADSAGSGVGIVVRVIVGVLTAPLAALAAAVLYFDLRKIAGGGSPDVGQGPGLGGSSDATQAFGSESGPTGAA
jgi:ABC-type multidrug transport system fused ATPase/permease subunit